MNKDLIIKQGELYYIKGIVASLIADRKTALMRSFKNGVVLSEQNNECSRFPKYLYIHIASEQPVKKGEWCLWNSQHEYHLVRAHSDNALLHYKVIATMDESLNLPKIPDEFIREYAEKDGKISEMLVQIHHGTGVFKGFTGMIATSLDNFVIIKNK